MIVDVNLNRATLESFVVEASFFREFEVWVPSTVEITENGEINYPLRGTSHEKQLRYRDNIPKALQGSGWVKKKLDPGKLFADFAFLGFSDEIALKEQVQGFILEYGPLWLTKEAAGLRTVIGPGDFWTPFSPEDPEDIWSTDPVKDNSAPWKPLEYVYDFWRYSNDYRNILRIGLAIFAEQRELRRNRVREIEFTFTALADGKRILAFTDDCKETAQEIVGKYLAHVKGERWLFTWEGDTAKVELSNYWGFLWVAWYLMAQFLSKSPVVAICDECGKPHMRVRKPKKGLRTYCPDCRESYRHSKREWARKQVSEGTD